MSNSLLTGVRVIELGHLLAGPWCTRLLADFGAEVIKIERPKIGDGLRSWGRQVNGVSLWWLVHNRNKYSVSLDLKHPKGIQVVEHLIGMSDIVVENFRPGVLEKLGLGYARLKELNPSLILVRISGFGQSGPNAGRPAFGSVAEAMGGIRYLTGYPDLPPARISLSLGDTLAGMYAAFSAVTALVHRERSREACGEVIDVALTEAAFSVLESSLPEYDVFGEVRERMGTSLPGVVPSNTYRTKDGSWIVVGGNDDAVFKRLMVAIDRSDLAEDPTLASNAGRVAGRDMLDEVIAEWVQTRTTQEALETLENAAVPAGPIYSIADIVEDPQFQARDMILSMDSPIGKLRVAGVVPKVQFRPGSVDWLGPKLGEHTNDVLEQLLGLAPDEIERLRQEGIV